MRKAWLGLALLSASWLFGLSYYQAAQMPTWDDCNAWLKAWHEIDSLPGLAFQLAWLARMVACPALVIAGVLLMGGVPVRLPSRGLCVLIAGFMLPACWWLPMPYQLAAWVMLVGAALGTLLGQRRPYPARAGLAGGAILLLQALMLMGYASATARCHDLPDPIPTFLADVAGLLTLDSAACGPHVALHTMRQVYMLGATWELLLDPATWCMLTGGVGLLTLAFRAIHGPSARRWLLRQLAVWVLIVLLWLPVRAGLLMALFIHRALLLDYDAPVNLMNQFWSPWTHLLMLAGPVLLAWRFAGLSLPVPREIPKPLSGSSKFFIGVAGGLAALATACFMLAVLWNPLGARKAGRVLVDEHHSEWERTDKPMDTEWYGQKSGYNYYCIYEYLTRFYDMDRQFTPTTDELLAQYDVLILKTPTSAYAPAEVDAIVRFVDQGGGLLLIGEHTTVFGTGTYLNQVADRFGFAFLPDCLFSISGSPFEQAYHPGKVPHPVVQHLPPPRGETAPMNFAVSCSIDPQGPGRAVILSTGLKNMFADYHASNFYPQVTDVPESRYGAFVQLWATWKGKGQVLAFTDSTIFSNFSTFEPGKAELMLGMVEWLNHRSVPGYFRLLLAVIAAIALALCLLFAWNHPGAGFVVAATALLTLVLTGIVIHQHQRTMMPVVKMKPGAPPLVRVAVDRTLCDGPLSQAGFILGKPDGFGIFERWILRLGYFIKRTGGADSLSDDNDMLLFLYPDQRVSPVFRQQVADYVARGHKLLVIDAPENVESTSAELLEGFGLSLDRTVKLTGSLVPPAGWPTGVVAESACAVRGGEPLISIDGVPVAATSKHGQGTVTLIGFGQRFTDPRMGLTGDVEPDAEQRKVFDLEFTLLRWLLEDVVWSPPAATATAPATAPTAETLP